MTGETVFGWHCLTCQTESPESYTCIEAAEDGGLAHAIQPVTDRLDAAEAAVHAYEHDLMRWEDPCVPDVKVLRGIREALGIDGGHYGDGCHLCCDAPRRWEYYHHTEPQWAARCTPTEATS